MNRDDAEDAILKLFAQYSTQAATAGPAVLKALSDGKLYEMYVLSELVTDLVNRGCQLVFCGTTLKFKAAPGKIKSSDPHFEVHTPRGIVLLLYVDIEFVTLGRNQTGRTDLSCTHELDIVIVTPGGDYPSFGDIWLGVECKSTANFGKQLIKEVLGVRREMALLHRPRRSMLSDAGLSPLKRVSSDPPSEFWLTYIDPAGDNYRQSPSAFGVELRHIQP